MRDVAVVAFAQAPNVRRDSDRNEVEILMPVLHEVREKVGLERDDIDFVVHGSTDFQAGMPFSFVGALDAYGAWPPINESHVEMDGAWALYEAWVKLQTGEIDTALAFAYGKGSPGDLVDVLRLQLDPYLVFPLGIDPIGMAAIQCRAYLEGVGRTEADMASVAVRDRRNGMTNPCAQVTGEFTVEGLLAEPMFVSPLRRHDCPPISDGACAVILAAGDRARDLVEHPAWVVGIDHRIEAPGLGMRDLTVSESTRIAAEKANASGTFDVAELHAPFTHQSLILEDTLGIDAAVTQVNPSGGALAANPFMVAGLTRIGEAAQRVLDGAAGRALAHATSGPCLQQNLVCVLEAREG
ncbi:MAG: thiolase domain-containing protein [Acidimicrobiia bacterium]|nr:thiolase domain-containing protein [Acidimicrobiia bacterium]